MPLLPCSNLGKLSSAQLSFFCLYCKPFRNRFVKSLLKIKILYQITELCMALISRLHCIMITGCSSIHSDLKCPITFGNSKMVKFQIFNFFLLEVVVYILYFDNSTQKNFFFTKRPFLGSMKWPNFDDFGKIYYFYVVTSIKY